MQTVLLEINDDIKDVVLSFLRILPNNAIKIYEYDDTTFTPEDALAYEIATAERINGESYSLESLKVRYGL